MKFVLGRLIPCVNHFIQHAEVTSERTNLSPFTKDYRGEASRMRFNILSDSEQENIIQLPQFHQGGVFQNPHSRMCLKMHSEWENMI